MKNIVIAGEYKDYEVMFNFGKLYFLFGMKTQEIPKTNVAKWEVVDNVQTDSYWGKVVGAGVGGLLLGPLGAILGATAVNKNVVNNYLISLEYNSGKKSLLQLDAQGYKNLIKTLF
jgi:hypothetical protein